MIHWFSFIQQNTRTKSAIIAKQAKWKKKATLMQKQTNQQNIRRQSTITKQTILYITTHRHQRICLISLCNGRKIKNKLLITVAKIKRPPQDETEKNLLVI